MALSAHLSEIMLFYKMVNSKLIVMQLKPRDSSFITPEMKFGVKFQSPLTPNGCQVYICEF